MKIKKLFFVALIGLQGLLTTCSKVKISGCLAGTVSVYEASKAYFHFKPGTWWIYRNIVRDTTDSFWVEQEFSYISTPSSEDDDRKCYEQIVTRITSAEFITRNPKLPNDGDYNRSVLNIALGGGEYGRCIGHIVLVL